MNKLSRFLILPLLAFVFVFAGLFLNAKPAQALSSEVLCQWQDSGHIECKRPNAVGSLMNSILGFFDTLTVDPNAIPRVGGIVSNTPVGALLNAADWNSQIGSTYPTLICGTLTPNATCRDYFYNPQFSQNAGYPIFCNPDNNGLLSRNCLHFNLTQESAKFAYASDATGAVTDNSDPNHLFAVGNIDDALTDPTGDRCGVTNPGNCVKEDGSAFNGEGLDTTTFTEEVQAELLEASGGCEDNLDSALSFVLCPISEFLTDTLTKMITAVTKLLENPDLTNSQNLKNAVNSMITLANSFYILIFLFIILANFVAIPGLDNYTVKKALPKLIVAIILTQFSLLICQAVLDLGNILAIALPNQILRAFPGVTGSTPAEAFSQTIVPQIDRIKNGGDMLEALGKFAIFNLTMLVGLVVAIIAFIYIVARYLFLLGLVLSAPLAFAAWVLPNTEQFFKKWWQYFLKLSIMFLLVNLLFVLGAVFSFLFAEGDLTAGGPSGGFANFMGSIISILIPIIVLVLIPKTLKMSGAIMAKAKEAGSKAIANAKDTRAGKAATGAVSKSAQEGKLAELKAKGFGKASESSLLKGTKAGRGVKQKGLRLEDSVKEAQKKDIGLMDLEEQQRIASEVKNGKQTDRAKVASGIIQKNHAEKQREARAAILDGKAPMNAKDRQSYDANARAAGGKSYAESVVAWDMERQGRLDPNLSVQQKEQNALLSLHSNMLAQYSDPAAIDADIKAGFLPEGTTREQAAYYHVKRAAANRQATKNPAILQAVQAANPNATPEQQRVIAYNQQPNGYEQLAKNQLTALGINDAPLPAPPPPPISDIRLKRNVKLVNNFENGIKIYRFKYLWSNTEYVGVMAQDLLLTHPSAVLTDKLGFYRVDYNSLGLQMVTYQEYLANPNSIHLVKIKN